jgi:hypothetical protein
MRREDGSSGKTVPSKFKVAWTLEVKIEGVSDNQQSDASPQQQNSGGTTWQPRSGGEHGELYGGELDSSLFLQIDCATLWPSS